MADRLERKKFSRKVISVKTRFGEIKVKIGKIGNQINNIAPEYESCKEIAVKQGIPLKDVYDEAKEAARKALFQEIVDRNVGTKKTVANS